MSRLLVVPLLRALAALTGCSAEPRQADEPPVTPAHVGDVLRSNLDGLRDVSRLSCGTVDGDYTEGRFRVAGRDFRAFAEALPARLNGAYRLRTSCANDTACVVLGRDRFGYGVVMSITDGSWSRARTSAWAPDASA